MAEKALKDRWIGDFEKRLRYCNRVGWDANCRAERERQSHECKSVIDQKADAETHQKRRRLCGDVVRVQCGHKSSGGD